MLPTAVRRLAIAPLLAVCASGAIVAITAGPASAATSGTVQLRSGTLKVRAAATSVSAQVATLRNRAKVTIRCKVNGQYTNGSVRKTAQWDLLSSSGYISHAYVQTRQSIPTCPPPPAPSAAAGPLTTASNAAFLAAAVGPAQASQREFKVPASVTLAQAILESSWGRSGLSLNDRNYFGMKCFGNPGQIAIGCHDYKTNECDLTKCWEIVDSFRVYKSPTDSFRDHGRQLAVLSRYAAAFQYSSNPDQFAAEVHKGGYATDPQYSTKLVKLMTQYNLYRYDLR
jgi:flagellar protein FlgJ